MDGDDSLHCSSAAAAAAPTGKHDRLSRILYASLPPREDTEKICKASPHISVLNHEVMTRPYDSLSPEDLEKHSSLLETPAPTAHPVLIARHMLRLASFLQSLHPDLHGEIRSLSETPRAMAVRLVDLANSLVTTNDKFLGSIECMECIIIQSVYHANVGNLRRSWLAGRRAISIAQLMGKSTAVSLFVLSVCCLQLSRPRRFRCALAYIYYSVCCPEHNVLMVC